MIEHCSQIARQLNIGDLKNGADSVEIRTWYNFSLGNSEELYTLKLLDTNFIISYFLFYLKPYDYESKTNGNWNPLIQPIIDSVVSKSVLLKKEDCKNLGLANIWNLRSQSELKIPDSIGFTDCESYVIEIAYKKRYKFLRFHCPNAYFEKLKLNDITNFMKCFDEIISLCA